MKYKQILITIVIICIVSILGGYMALTMNTKPNKLNVKAELSQEVSNQTLQVSGKVPTWLSGTLVRNGPVTVSIDGKSNLHWFDGLAMLHAFSFHAGNISYSNKFLRSDAYHTVFEKGSLNYDGFAQDPCRSLFKKFLTFFIPQSQPPIQNANVNVAKIAGQYVAMTEVPLPVKFDPKTLDTLGVLNYQDELPKDKCWESAHPHADRHSQETLNYLIKFGRNSFYTIYSLKDGSAERNVIAEIPVVHPAYMHSFAITENYVIFTEFPFVVKPLDLITKGKPFITNFSWQPERGTNFMVINRKTGKLMGNYKTKPFFAFHHANAFEKDNMLHIDVVTYENAKIITGDILHVDTHQSVNDDYPAKLERYSLSLATGKISSTALLEKSVEFPRINEHFDGHPYRYMYLAGFAENPDNKDELVNASYLYKVNTETKELLSWSEKGCSPGEPIFVQSPNALEEDEGVVMTVVSDQFRHDSFLLILDGKTFKEVARARTSHLIPTGLHAQYFNL
jgi:beta,beta-carotene 9',10'-dioxygenase